jgi:hypothetical protein
VSRKLEKISHTLQSFIDSASHGSAARIPSNPQAVEDRSTPRSYSKSDFGSPFEGDSSFNAYSKLATQAFESTLPANEQHAANEAVSTAFETLRRLMDQKDPPEINPVLEVQNSADCVGLAELPMPSMELVLKILKLCRSMSHFP